MSDTNISLEDAKRAKREAQRSQQRQQSPLVDAENKTIRSPSMGKGDIQDQYLTARGGLNLREEVVSCQGRAATWANALEEFEDYIWRTSKAADTWSEEKGVRANNHRFTEKSSKDKYGRTLGVDRKARELWGDSLTTVLVTRRATPFGKDGTPQPPVDHLQDLLAGRDNVNSAYHRHIGENHGMRFARLSVLEPHRNGYAHIHDGLWIEDPDNLLDEMDIMPAVDSHLRAVPQARPRNHGPDAVDIRTNPDTKQFTTDKPATTALPRELTKFLGGLAPFDESEERDFNVPNVLQMSKSRLRFYALIWATGKRQWVPDQSYFRRFVMASQEWYGIENDEQQTETYIDPKDFDSGGGVDTVTVEGRDIEFERRDGGKPST
jgi:hypothetical protein